MINVQDTSANNDMLDNDKGTFCPSVFYTLYTTTWPGSSLKGHIWALRTATQTHFFQQRLNRLYGDKQLCDKLQGQSLTAAQQGWVVFHLQVIELIKLQGRLRRKKRNLRRWCLLCAAPAGSGGARRRSDRPAWSCHPHPSQRWGAWTWGEPSYWFCAPANKRSRD